jgi:hypothetical protein
MPSLGLAAAPSNETPSRRTVSTVEHSQTCRLSNAFIFNAYKNQPIYEKSMLRLLFAEKCNAPQYASSIYE